jgi:hypothetical protein
MLAAEFMVRVENAKAELQRLKPSVNFEFMSWLKATTH